MGFFSFKTCDTDESIPAASATHPRAGETVYLLQPGGMRPVGGVYDGYGQLGDTDIHDWLARMNAHAWYGDPSKLSAEERRSIGITLDMGSYYVDNETGALWVDLMTPLPKASGFRQFGRYDEVIEELGTTPNELIGLNRWREHPIAAEIPYPVKLSYNPEARYEDWPASPACPHQGFFYPEASADSSPADSSSALKLEMIVGYPVEDGYRIESRSTPLPVEEGIVKQGDHWYPGAGEPEIAIPDGNWASHLAEVIPYAINEGSAASGVEFHEPDLEDFDPVYGDDGEEIDPGVTGFVAWRLEGSREAFEELHLDWPAPSLPSLGDGDERTALQFIEEAFPGHPQPDTDSGLLGENAGEHKGQHWSRLYPVVAHQVSVWHTKNPWQSDDDAPSPG